MLQSLPTTCANVSRLTKRGRLEEVARGNPCSSCKSDARLASIIDYNRTARRRLKTSDILKLPDVIAILTGSATNAKILLLNAHFTAFRKWRMALLWLDSLARSEQIHGLAAAGR